MGSGLLPENAPPVGSFVVGAQKKDFKKWDSLARYLVRIGEMKESIKMIQQALEGIPNLRILNIDFLIKNLLQLLNCRNKNFM